MLIIEQQFSYGVTFLRETFIPTLNQMLVMLIFILAGYVLNKAHVLGNKSDKVMSKLENNLFVPALIINTFMMNCTLENIKASWKYIVYSAGLLVIAMLIAHFVAKLFTNNEYGIHIFEYALTFGNFSFMGNAVVLALLGEEMLFKYMIFTLPMNIVVYTWGTFILTPNDAEGRSFGIKRLINPIIISLIIGLILGLTNAQQYMPYALKASLESASKCMSPMAMILTGFVMADYPLKTLVTKKRIYTVTALRLIVIPSIFLTLLKLIKAPQEMIILALFAYATPLGLNTVIFPSAYGGDTKTGARMASISHVLCIFTIPLMYMLFIG